METRSVNEMVGAHVGADVLVLMVTTITGMLIMIFFVMVLLMIDGAVL